VNVPTNPTPHSSCGTSRGLPVLPSGVTSGKRARAMITRYEASGSIIVICSNNVSTTLTSSLARREISLRELQREANNIPPKKVRGRRATEPYHFENWENRAIIKRHRGSTSAFCIIIIFVDRKIDVIRNSQDIHAHMTDYVYNSNAIILIRILQLVAEKISIYLLLLVANACTIHRIEMTDEGRKRQHQFATFNNWSLLIVFLISSFPEKKLPRSSTCCEQFETNKINTIDPSSWIATLIFNVNRDARAKRARTLLMGHDLLINRCTLERSADTMTRAPMDARAHPRVSFANSRWLD